MEELYTMSSGSPETRTRILTAAWRLLEAGGGRDVRMTDIAKEAGVSRQAVYLHFPTRTDLLVATTHHIDTVKDTDARLVRSRSARSGEDRLEAFVEAWGNYIPEIYGVGKALMIMGETDEAARTAWDGRMQALRHGCRAAIDALVRDGRLPAAYSADQATDLLWTLLSVRNWEHLTIDCGWPQEQYLEKTQALTRRLFIDPPSAARAPQPP